MLRDFENTGNHEVKRTLHVTLPRHEDAPSERLQRGYVRGISCSVRGKLALPELCVSCWCGGEAAPVVPMPEASMHEDCQATRGENDVGTPWEIGDMQAKPETSAV